MPDPQPDGPPPRVELWFTRAAAIWFGVSAVLVLVGWYKTINLLMLLGYVMAALLGVNGWVARSMAGRVAARRRPTDPVFPGEEVVLTVEVSNPSPRPTTALLTDRAGDNRAAWLLAPLPTGASRPVTARWSFPTRGRHPTGPLVVDASYPFGVIHARRQIAADGDVLVLPPVGRVSLEMFRRWLVRGGAGDGMSRRPTRRSAPGHGDVRGVRPYRSGDSPRDIHWRSTARRNQLLVREYDKSEPLDLVLVVDPWVPADRPPGPDARLEWALSLTMSLGQAWCEADDPADLTLIVPGAPPVVRSGRAGPGFCRRAFDLLADLNGSPVVPLIPAELARRRSNRSARVVVSTRPNSPLADGLRRAGLPFAAVDPSAPPAWFTPPAGLPLPSYR